ncbi:MAG: thiamine pyrophosphate-dependent enzyme [Thermodesulfobacteriota bacterium]|nr:thiamine pyrophosphate-dependent enzyme [Thermodesulfobacteriota bacterium]
MMKERIYGPTKLMAPMIAAQRIMFCPGCQHGMTQKIICEVLEEMDIAGRSIVVSGVGCTTALGSVIGIDNIMYAHGPSPAVASGIKHVLGDDVVVFTQQGDGDCAAIGMGFLVGAAARSEKITVIMMNNGIFAMTGGQLAPTTLMGQMTTTTPEKRDSSFGYPLHVPELLATIKGVAYSARGAYTTPANYQRTKKYLKTAFQKQMDNVGLSFIEILSTCPVGWRMSPVEAIKWIEQSVIQEFPLGEFRNVDRID